MGDINNSGIIGNIENASVFSVGPNSRVQVTTVEQPLAVQLQALTEAVQAFDGPVETHAQLLAAQREVAAELQGDQPDKGKVLAKLKQIAAAAGSAATIVAAANALAGAVQLVL